MAHARAVRRGGLRHRVRRVPAHRGADGLLAKAFLALPLESVALRINIGSAAFSAITAGLLAIVALRASAPWPFAATGALAWAFARDVWAQSVVAEVYTLHALLLATTLLFLLRWSERRRTPDLYGAAAAFGLSLANHYPLTLLAAPAQAMFVLRTARGAGVKRAVWARAMGLSLAGLLLYVYLPLCASLSPPLNWGEPSTWPRFLAHVSRAIYRDVEFTEAASLGTKAKFAALFLSHLAGQWTAPVLLGFGALGVYRLRRHPAARDLLLGMAATVALGLIAIPGYGYEHEDIQRFDELYLPVYLSLAPVLACGLAAAAGLAARVSRPAGLGAAIVCSSVFVVPLALHVRDNDLSADRLAETYNRFALESLPRDAVYFTSGDYTSFPTLYLQAVAGVRRDVLLANVTGDVSPAARAYLATIQPDTDGTSIAALQEALVRHGKRPVFVAAKSDLRIVARVEPFGLVYRVRRDGDRPIGPPPDLLAANLPVPASVPAADGLGKSLVADYWIMRGEALFVRGDTTAARASMLAAVQLLPTSREALNNIGSLMAECGFLADAERLFRAAATLSPSYAMPRHNLAKLLRSVGRVDDAIAAYRDLVRVAPGDAEARAELDALLSGRGLAPPLQSDRVEAFLHAIERDPRNPALYNNLGNVYAEERDGRRAREAYEKALSIDPGYAMAYKNLALLHQDLLVDSAAAKRYLRKYRSLGQQN